MHAGTALPALSEYIGRNENITVRILDFGTDAVPADPSLTWKELGELRMGPQGRSGRCGGENNSLSPAWNRIHFLSCPTRSNCIDWLMPIAHRCVKHKSVTSLILIRRKILILKKNRLIVLFSLQVQTRVSKLYLDSQNRQPPSTRVYTRVSGPKAGGLLRHKSTRRICQC